MSKWDTLAQEVVKNLQTINDEQGIKNVCQSVVQKIKEAYPHTPNSRKNPLATVRKAVSAAFPSTSKQKHPWQFFTESGKGNIKRWEHSALKYLTFSTEEWDAMGDEARQEWKAQQQAKIEPKTAVTTTLNDMNIEQLELDAETQKVVEEAIAHSGMSLADFVRQASQVYAKTVVGKVKQYESDLSAVTTQGLMGESYKTHPGRAEELTRRAIYALETHNNQCTEKAQKWHINQTAIQTLTGSRPATVGKILEQYKTRISDHNAKHELNPYDNRKPGIKIDEAINLVEIVPDGLNIN
jgi:hypothetical protein